MEYFDDNPVMLNPHPSRRRMGSEHMNRQPMYWQDPNGQLLVPAGAPVGGVHRSASVSAPRRPAQIQIINEQVDSHSPNHSPHRHHRSTSRGYDHHYADYSDDDWDDRAHSPHRRRRHSHYHQSHSRSPSPYYDTEYERRLKKLEELEKKEEEEEAREKEKRMKKLEKLEKLEKKEKEEEAREKYEEERILEEAKKAKEKEKLKEMKKKAIEEYEEEQKKEKAKKEKEKKERDEEFKERVKKTFGKAGYSDESIEKILKEEGKEKKEGHGKKSSKQIMDLTRPTYIKVHRKHLSPETLDIYQLPWEWDHRDSNYIIVKRWIPEHDQEILFEHTKTLRERKQIVDTTVELEKRKNDQLLLVRRKSPGRRRSPSRSWMFT